MLIAFIATCPTGCFNGGNCTTPGICTCPSMWTGNDCSQGMQCYIRMYIDNVCNPIANIKQIN